MLYLGGLSYVFLAPFILDVFLYSRSLHFFLYSRSLHFLLQCYHRARRYIRRLRARRAPHDNSLIFLYLRTSLFIVDDAARPVAGSTISGFVSFSIFSSSPSSRGITVFYLYLLHINTPASGLDETRQTGPFPSPVPFA